MFRVQRERCRSMPSRRIIYRRFPKRFAPSRFQDANQNRYCSDETIDAKISRWFVLTNYTARTLVPLDRTIRRPQTLENLDW
jgi:hypothetical protein